MGLAVGHVVELVGPDRAVRLLLGNLVGEAPGILHVVVGVAIGDRRHLDQLRAAEPQHVLLFLALGLGNHDHRAVAEGVADQRKPDAGVAGGAFDDGPAGFQHAPPLGIAHDVERGAVLDRAAGVQELALAEDLAAGRLGRAVETDQRRVSDQFDKTRYGCHDASRPRRKRRTLSRNSHQCHDLRRAGRGQELISKRDSPGLSGIKWDKWDPAGQSRPRLKGRGRGIKSPARPGRASLKGLARGIWSCARHIESRATRMTPSARDGVVHARRLARSCVASRVYARVSARRASHHGPGRACPLWGARLARISHQGHGLRGAVRPTE